MVDHVYYRGSNSDVVQLYDVSPDAEATVFVKYTDDARSREIAKGNTDFPKSQEVTVRAGDAQFSPSQWIFVNGRIVLGYRGYMVHFVSNTSEVPSAEELKAQYQVAVKEINSALRFPIMSIASFLIGLALVTMMIIVIDVAEARLEKRRHRSSLKDCSNCSLFC